MVEYKKQNVLKISEDLVIEYLFYRNNHILGASSIFLSIKRNIEKVKMSIKEGTLTPSSASIIILDNNDNPYAYDEWFKIDRKVNNKWEEVNQINNNYIVRDIAYDIRKNKKLETTVKWGDLYGELKKGEYRLVKKVYDNDGNDIYISTEFIIEK